MRRTAIVALVLGLTAVPVAEASPAPQARVWVTTPDRAELLQERPRVAFGSTASTHPTIVVDPDRAYQPIDAITWRTLATGQGTGQLTNIDVRATARHLRITSTGSAPNWWSIADIRLYN